MQRLTDNRRSQGHPDILRHKFFILDTFSLFKVSVTRKFSTRDLRQLKFSFEKILYK